LLGAPRILVVDGDSVAREALKGLLEAERYHVEGRAHAAAALASLDACQPDVIMAARDAAGLEGLDVLARVRDRWPECLRILLVNEEETGRLGTTPEGLAYGVLPKPLRPLELRAMLRAASQVVELTRRNRQLATMVERQFEFIQLLEGKHPDGALVLETARRLSGVPAPRPRNKGSR
jgi:adenylate cyclase